MFKKILFLGVFLLSQLSLKAFFFDKDYELDKCILEMSINMKGLQNNMISLNDKLRESFFIGVSACAIIFVVMIVSMGVYDKRSENIKKTL